MSNVASYGFLKKRLETHDLHIHALWFDIYTGDIYYFSRGAKRFLHVDEENADRIVEEIRRYYSWFEHLFIIIIINELKRFNWFKIQTLYNFID